MASFSIERRFFLITKGVLLGTTLVGIIASVTWTPVGILEPAGNVLLGIFLLTLATVLNRTRGQNSR